MNKNSKRTPANEMIPGDIFHPGYFLAEEMKELGMKQTELAEKLGLSRPEMSLLINGRRNFTVALAVKLEKVFGISAEIWMKFQMRYEIDLMRKRMAEELKELKVTAKKKAEIRTTILHAA